MSSVNEEFPAHVFSLLAARVGMTKQSLGEFVAALQEAGYLRAAPVPERTRTAALAIACLVRQIADTRVRIRLLAGGTCTAGPTPSGGQVVAVLPLAVPS